MSVPLLFCFFRRWVPIGLYLLGSAFLLAKSSQYPACSGLAFVALIPLFAVVAHARGKNVFLLAGFWGICYSGAAWLCGLISPPEFSRAVPMMVAAPAVFAGLARAAIARFGCSPVILALSWMLIDLSLGQIGYGSGVSFATPESGSLGALVAKFGGYALIAFVIASANAIILSLVCSVHCELVRVGRALLGQVRAFADALYAARLRQSDSVYVGSPRSPPVCSRIYANHV
jgi:hypothetical protein